MCAHFWLHTGPFDGLTDPLPHPRIVTERELWEAFEVYFRGERYRFDEEQYDAFLDHVQYRLIQMRSSAPIALCEVEFPKDSRRLKDTLLGLMHGTLLTRHEILGTVTAEEVERSEKTLLPNDSLQVPPVLAHVGEYDIAFKEIEFAGKERTFRKPDVDEGIVGTVIVELRGYSSERAISQLAEEVSLLAQSHYRSVRHLEPEAKLNPETFQNHLAFGIGAMKLAVLHTSNRDTFERRIANAVRLLAEADRQRSDPIGLALCVTAIDALLGRPGQEMTKTLADFVAGLLEPQVELRRVAADYFADLYDKRSRVLHGDRLEGNRELREASRALAASVLWAVWSCKDFFERCFAETPKPNEFFEKLREDFVKPDLQPGLLELPVRKLWQARSG